MTPSTQPSPTTGQGTPRHSHHVTSSPTSGLELPSLSHPLQPHDSSAMGRQAFTNQLRTAVEAMAHTVSDLNHRSSSFWDLPIQGRFLGATHELPQFLNHQIWLPILIPIANRHIPESESEAPYLANPDEGLQLQISYPLAESWLSGSLGDLTTSVASANTSNMQGLSPFEWFLLEQWARQWKAAAASWLQIPTNRLPSTPKVWLIWAFTPLHQNEQPGYLAAQVPTAWLVAFSDDLGPSNQVTQDTTPGTSLPDTFFSDRWYPVCLSAGVTRLTMAELQAIEPGDLLVLDKSSPQALLWQVPGDDDTSPHTAYSAHRHPGHEPPAKTTVGQGWKPVRVGHLPIPRLPIQSAPTTHEYSTTIAIQDPHAMAPTAPQASHSSRHAGASLWDDLPVDVRAEFLPVKLPMSQVKQMSDGLVIEVGDWIRTPMRLHVDGKTLAHGELVMVGDKLGVRITAVAGHETHSGHAHATESESHALAPIHPDDAHDPHMGLSSGMPLASDQPGEHQPTQPGSDTDVDEALSSLFDDEFDNDDDEDDW
jgi:flagellar motor switch/type III secretory pathway protein FliN